MNSRESLAATELQERGSIDIEAWNVNEDTDLSLMEPVDSYLEEIEPEEDDDES